jgi:uncharacterized protein YbjT (DUF2867 family)
VTVKTILVIGAAGFTGAAIVGEALRRGIGVVAYVRDKAKAAGLPAGVRVVEGDGRDAAALAPALAGVDAVVIPAGGRKDPVSAEIVKTAIPLLKQRGIGRLVAVSAYGAVDGRGFYAWVMKTAAKPVVADKVAMEQALRTSGLEWTAVRPGILTNGSPTGAVKAVDNAVLKGMPRISRADVAGFILDELQSPKFVGRAPVLSA